MAGAGKYKYRSSVIVEDDDDEGEGDIEFARSNPSDSANVVDRFIRVIESKDQVRHFLNNGLKNLLFNCSDSLNIFGVEAISEFF